MNFHDINSIFRPSIDETTSRRRDCKGYFIAMLTFHWNNGVVSTFDNQIPRD